MLMICLLNTYVSLDVKLVQLTGQSEILTVYWLKIQDYPIGIPIKSFFHLYTSQTKYRLKYTFASRLTRDIPGSTVVKCDIN